MRTTIKPLFTIALIAALATACKKDDDDTATPAPPPPVNEEEVITTLVLTFTDTETPTEVFEIRFTDLDGDGGNDPVIASDILPTGRAFSLTLSVLNESVSPVDNITEEIETEGDAHQFFFELTNSTLSILYGDQDVNGNPIGLVNTAITGGPSLGSLTVTLRHDPDKNGAGVAQGDITNAGGDTDIEVTFPVRVE